MISFLVLCIHINTHSRIFSHQKTPTTTKKHHLLLLYLFFLICGQGFYNTNSLLAKPVSDSKLLRFLCPSKTVAWIFSLEKWTSCLAENDFCLANIFVRFCMASKFRIDTTSLEVEERTLLNIGTSFALKWLLQMNRRL